MTDAGAVPAIGVNGVSCEIDCRTVDLALIACRVPVVPSNTVTSCSVRAICVDEVRAVQSTGSPISQPNQIPDTHTSLADTSRGASRIDNGRTVHVTGIIGGPRKLGLAHTVPVPHQRGVGVLYLRAIHGAGPVPDDPGKPSGAPTGRPINLRGIPIANTGAVIPARKVRTVPVVPSGTGAPHRCDSGAGCVGDVGAVDLAGDGGVHPLEVGYALAGVVRGRRFVRVH